MESFRAIRVIPFAVYSERVKTHIERAYGVPVITRDVPDPLTGDLNGEIGRAHV